jgi:hypothetical protein
MNHLVSTLRIISHIHDWPVSLLARSGHPCNRELINVFRKSAEKHLRIYGLRTSIPNQPWRVAATINGKPHTIERGECLIDPINRSGVQVPQVCYHIQLGPVQTCDTRTVEVDGKLARACGTFAADGKNVITTSQRAVAAQREAFEGILGSHLLGSTVSI